MYTSTPHFNWETSPGDQIMTKPPFYSMQAFTKETLQRATRDDVIKWKHFLRYWALCEGNPPVNGGFPSQRPVTRSFDVFFVLRLNKLLRKQSRRRWFETPLRSLWFHCNGNEKPGIHLCAFAALCEYVKTTFIYTNVQMEIKTDKNQTNGVSWLYHII